MPLWYCILLITTAPLKAAGILHCTQARQVLDVVLKLSTLVWELHIHVHLGMQKESQELSAGPSACLHEPVAHLTQMPFRVQGFFALTVTFVQRDEKQSLKFIVKPLCFMPLSWFVLRMKERISNQAKNTFGKKGRWKISKSLF